MSCLIKLFNTSSNFKILLFRFHPSTTIYPHSHCFHPYSHCFHPFSLSSFRLIRLVWLIYHSDCCRQQQWALVAALAFVDVYNRICVFCPLIFWNWLTIAIVEQYSIHPSCRRTLLCTVCYIVWFNGNQRLSTSPTPCKPCGPCHL